MFVKRIHVALTALAVAAAAGTAVVLWTDEPVRSEVGAWITRAPAGPTSPAGTPDDGRSAPAGGSPGTGDGTRPDRTPGATRPGTRPPVVDHGPRTGNRVALTFDADMTDGMLYQLRTGRVRSYANLRIIDLLEREEVPATFFLTGKWVERYPDVTRRIAGNPRFELANHSYGHLAFTGDCYGLPRIPAHEMTRDVERTFEVVQAYGGRQTRYFRFPGLCHDGPALAALAPLGTTVVDGDVVSGDPFATAWKPIVEAVLGQVKPGSVIVLHVTEANAAMTDEALPHILAGLAERGLVPATLSEVLGDGDQPDSE